MLGGGDRVKRCSFWKELPSQGALQPSARDCVGVAGKKAGEPPKTRRAWDGAFAGTLHTGDGKPLEKNPCQAANREWPPGAGWPEMRHKIGGLGFGFAILIDARVNQLSSPFSHASSRPSIRPISQRVLNGTEARVERSMLQGRKGHAPFRRIRTRASA